MGDQALNGELLAGPGRKKEPNNRMLLSDVAARTTFGNGATTIRELFQIRIRPQSMGPRGLALRTARGAGIQSADDVRSICGLDSVQ